MSDFSIKVASFNLKRDFGFYNKYSWINRRSIAADIIKQSGAGIIGVQELLPSMKNDVKQLLQNEFSIFGAGRFSGTKLKNDEHTDIIIKSEQYEVVSTKTFWLSKNPEKQSSRALLAFFPRICTVAEVKIKGSDKTIRVFNTHFDHISHFARVLSVKIILKYISEYNKQNPMPTILMGDFNCKSTSKPIRILRENLHNYSNIKLTDVHHSCNTSSVSNTFHNFSGKIKAGTSPIDYIFASEEFEIVDSKIITDSQDGCYPSDHFPIISTLKFKN